MQIYDRDICESPYGQRSHAIRGDVYVFSGAAQRAFPASAHQFIVVDDENTLQNSIARPLRHLVHDTETVRESKMRAFLRLTTLCPKVGQARRKRNVLLR